jgi:hypothetical protein
MDGTFRPFFVRRQVDSRLAIDLMAGETERRSVWVSGGFFDGKHEGRIAWRVSAISST